MKIGTKLRSKLKDDDPGIILASARNFVTKDGFLLSAGLAYYGLFSIVPIALLTVSIAGLFIGSQTAQSEITEVLTRYVGEDAATLLSKLFVDMAGRGMSTAGTVIGALLLLWGGTRLFLKLQNSFNIMWGVRLSDEVSSRQLLKHRLLTLSMIFLPVLVLFVALLFSAGITWLTGLGWLSWVQRTAEGVGPFAVTWIALATIMVILPDVRLNLRDCWLTSLLASAVCYAVTRGFGAWLGWSTDSSRIVLTSVSVLMTVIIWANVMAITLLVAVSLTRVRYEADGGVIQPYEYAARFSVILDRPQTPEKPND